MKNLFLFNLLLLGSASASPFITSIFAPNDATLTEACDNATRISVIPNDQRSEEDQKYGKRYSFTDLSQFAAKLKYTSFISSAGTAYNTCASVAERLEAEPPISKFKPGFLIVNSTSKALNLAEAKGYRTMLALIGADGKEILRITPTESQIGRATDWSPSCTGSGPCYWLGRNTFLFDVTPEVLNAAKDAVTLRILLSRGDGVETLDVNEQNYPTLR